jgi:excinuclease UvrABC nuclease subunit
VVVEFSRDELIEIRIALSRAADYTERHDELLAVFAAEMKAYQQQINKLEQQVNSESRWRSNISDQVASLPQVFTDLAVVKRNQESAASRTSIIAASFWAAIAVAVVAMFQAGGAKSKAEVHPPDHLANRPASPIQPVPNSR